VYLLESLDGRVYQGTAEDGDERRRLAEHNRGECWSTREFRPWALGSVVRGFRQVKGRFGANAFETDVKQLRVRQPGVRAKTAAVRQLLAGTLRRAGRPSWRERGLTLMDLMVRAPDQICF